MRLIDVDNITDKEIISYLGVRYASCLEDVRDLLNTQPTAYDVDAVVEQIRDAEDYCEDLSPTCDECQYFKEGKCLSGAIIDIVRKGGVE